MFFRKRVSKPMTEEMALRIKQLAKDNKDLAQHQIAAILEINQGRVSEVLTCKKFAHVSV